MTAYAARSPGAQRGLRNSVGGRPALWRASSGRAGFVYGLTARAVGADGGWISAGDEGGYGSAWRDCAVARARGASVSDRHPGNGSACDRDLIAGCAAASRDTAAGARCWAEAASVMAAAGIRGSGTGSGCRWVSAAELWVTELPEVATELIRGRALCRALRLAAVCHAITDNRRGATGDDLSTLWLIIDLCGKRCRCLRRWSYGGTGRAPSNLA